MVYYPEVGGLLTGSGRFINRKWMCFLPGSNGLLPGSNGLLPGSGMFITRKWFITWKWMVYYP